MFVSKRYGSRASDVYITKNSGFFDNLLPGDAVMADRGFTSSEEVMDTRQIASIRIHVKKAIMRMKSQKILNSKMSNKAFKKYPIFIQAQNPM